MKLFFTLLLSLLIMSEILLGQDWANLNRYKSENNSLSLSKENEQRIVFIGNSITEGWSQFYPEFFDGKPYINRGISGQTTPQMLLRFRQDVINLKPKVVIILAGTNDIAGNTGPSTLQMIMDNIISMTELAIANEIKVVLCSVLPAFDYPWITGKNPQNNIPALNEMIKFYSENNAIIYADYFSAMVDDKNGLKESLTYDGVHPNKLGYEVMIPLVDQAISKILQDIL